MAEQQQQERPLEQPDALAKTRALLTYYLQKPGVIPPNGKIYEAVLSERFLGWLLKKKHLDTVMPKKDTAHARSYWFHSVANAAFWEQRGDVSWRGMKRGGRRAIQFRTQRDESTDDMVERRRNEAAAAADRVSPPRGEKTTRSVSDSADEPSPKRARLPFANDVRPLAATRAHELQHALGTSTPVLLELPPFKPAIVPLPPAPLPLASLPAVPPAAPLVIDLAPAPEKKEDRVEETVDIPIPVAIVPPRPAVVAPAPARVLGHLVPLVSGERVTIDTRVGWSHGGCHVRARPEIARGVVGVSVDALETTPVHVYRVDGSPGKHVVPGAARGVLLADGEVLTVGERVTLRFDAAGQWVG